MAVISKYMDSNRLLRVATNDDLLAIQALLASHNLPYQDCASHLHNFLVLESAKKIVAVGGFELYAKQALLRSLAVASEYIGQGLGDTLYRALCDTARQHGVEQLFVLTTTAVTYFTARGFMSIDRNDVPEAIKNTRQFSALCPQSAVVLRREITP